jgi:hypothetical protein
MKRPAPSALLDWSIAIAGLWCSGGTLLDAWHHFHSDIETFFEWSHAVLYAGLFASFVVTGIALVRFRRQGYAWSRALPAGYESTLVGLGVFLLGGILDMIKHTLWGFEQGFDALLSVTHLLIGAGVLLIIAGPVRSAILRDRPPRTLGEQLPLLFALASMMELLHWGTQFIYQSEAERMNAPLDPARFPHDTFTLLSLLYYKQGIGLLAVIVQSLLLAGFACYIARRLRLAPGAIAVLFFTGNLFIALAHSNYTGQFVAVTVASIAAGAIGDLFRPQPDTGELRWSLAAFCMPASYWIVALAILAATMGGVWWSPDVISGSIVVAGAAGLFVNVLSTKNKARAEGAGL